MIKPELFDLVELLVDLPEHNLIMGEQGTIVEDYNKNNQNLNNF